MAKAWVQDWGGISPDGKELIHFYPQKDILKHRTDNGPAGCWCEPEIHLDGKTRVVNHQKIYVASK